MQLFILREKYGFTPNDFMRTNLRNDCFFSIFAVSKLKPFENSISNVFQIWSVQKPLRANERIIAELDLLNARLFLAMENQHIIFLWIAINKKRGYKTKKVVAFIGNSVYFAPEFNVTLLWQTVNLVDCRIFHPYNVTKTTLTQCDGLLKRMFVDGPIKIRLESISINKYQEQIEYTCQ